VENKETLQTRAVIRNTADLVQYLVDQLLTNSVVSTGVVVRCILLSTDHLLRVEKGSVSTSADLVDNIWLEIAVDRSWDIFSLSYDPGVSVSAKVRDGGVVKCSPVSEKKVLNP
jgi:hypothetical protein